MKIIADKVFSETMERIATKKSIFEKDIYFVQGAVKDSKGVGETVRVNFRAPIDDTSDEEASKMINFDIDAYKSDIELLRMRQFELYAERQCFKIALYMQKVRSIEIL